MIYNSQQDRNERHSLSKYERKPYMITSKRNVVTSLMLFILTLIMIYFSNGQYTIMNKSLYFRKLLKTTSKLNHGNSYPKGNLAPQQNTIHSPADMWMNPEDDPSWNPVDLPDCCNYDATRRHLSVVPGMITKYFSCDRRDTPLRYIGPGAGLTPDNLKMALQRHKGDIILMGDSLMRQWFAQLACYLRSQNWHGFPLKRDNFERELTKLLKEFQPSWKREGLGSFVGKSSFSFFDIPSMDDNIRTEQRAILQSTKSMSNKEILDLLFFYDRVYPREYGRERPLFVLNAGVHFNEKKYSSLRTTLQLLYNACREAGMKCIFRETTPQHFQNPSKNGLYIDIPKWLRKGCMKKSPEMFETLDGWRNDVLHSVVSETDEPTTEEKGFIKIMPLFDRLAFLTFAHHRKNDCTHFSPNPEYWEPWHVSLTQVLDNLHKEVSTVQKPTQ